MTSASVSNMTIQTATSKASAGYANKQDVQNDFLQVMISLNGKDSKVSSMPKNSGRDVADTAMKVQTKPGEMKRVNSQDAEKEVVENASDEVSAFSEKVKGVISEELDVTDEEIENAMETLGLTFLDLTDVTNMTKLVSLLTNCEDKVSLLVDDNFTNIVSQIGELSESLVNNTQMSVKDLQEMMSLATNQLTEPAPMEETGGEVVSQEVETPALEGSEGMEEIVNPEEQKISSEAQETNAGDVQVETVKDLEPAVADQEDMTEADSEQLISKPEEGLTLDNQKNTSEGTDAKNDFFDNRQQKNQTFSMQGAGESQMSGIGLQGTSHFEPVTGEITLQTGETVNVKEIINQIVENARTTIKSDNTTLEMLLNPEGLGKLFMEVTQRDGKVSAHIYTQDENVKQALENQMVQLKEQMNQSGTKVNSIEVSVGTHEFEKNLEEGQQEMGQENMQEKQQQRRTRNLNMNNLDELSGLMTEEEELVAKMMRDNGNSVNYTA